MRGLGLMEHKRLLPIGGGWPPDLWVPPSNGPRRDALDREGVLGIGPSTQLRAWMEAKPVADHRNWFEPTPMPNLRGIWRAVNPFEYFDHAVRLAPVAFFYRDRVPEDSNANAQIS
jgi:hypothetical protein